MYRLKCYSCGKEYDINEPLWKCECGGFFNIVSDITLDFNALDKNVFGLWRYQRFIPVFSRESIVSFGECFTPLVKEAIWGKDVFLKLDYLFPSGSYKDRGSTVLISKVKECGIDKIVEDSSGNAGASVAMYAAKAKIEADIYIPASTSKGKLVQVRAFGANLRLIDGDRQKTSEAILHAAESTYYASHVYNPFFFEGTKTFIFEIFEQLENNLPDNIIIPVGNGTLLIGTYIACKQLMGGGYIDKFPRFICVQSENCAPLTELLYNERTTYSDTLAEGIAIKNPLRLNQMGEIIKETGGEVITVSDQEIRDSLIEIMKLGYYIEPTSAAAIAAINKIELTGSTVVELTGSGLKANEKIFHLLHD